MSAQTAQSTFTTSLTTFGSDTTAPTVPTNLVATPVSTSEIDLTWNASTDDFAVAGYQILRDGVNIATTSLTNYVDTGLTASTTYTYRVNAFDNSRNYSALSAPSATTTFAIVVIPPATTTPATTTPSTGGSSGGSASLAIRNLAIIPDLHAANVSFDTTLTTQASVSWGLTSDHELGTVSLPLFTFAHEAMLTSLESNTLYYVRISVIASNGAHTYLDTSFRTSSGIGFGGLTNASNFRATPVQPDHIALSWTNPSSALFDAERILRSETFFPRDPNDGVVVYEGRGENFDDMNVVAGKMYYYTIFTRGTDGKFTSGAIAQARLALPGEPVVSYTDPFANLPQAKIVDPMIGALTLADFDFYQEGRLLPQVSGGTVAINGSETLTVKLAYNKVPEILKTIAFTLSDPHDPSQVFTFLLRVNADKTAYEANVGALGRSGQYKMAVTILDYKNQGLKRLQGDIRALVFGAQITERANDPLSLILVGAFALIVIAIVAGLRRNIPGSRPVSVHFSVSPIPTGSGFAGIGELFPTQKNAQTPVAHRTSVFRK